MGIRSPFTKEDKSSSGEKKKEGIREHLIKGFSLSIVLYFLLAYIQDYFIKSQPALNAHPYLIVLPSSFVIYIVTLAVAKVIDYLLAQRGY